MNNFFVYGFVRLYSAIIDMCSVLALPVLAGMKAVSSWNIGERAGLPPLRKPIGGRPVAWVHAASLGEAKLAIKFLGLLKRKYPDDVYVLTATTAAGVEYLRSQDIEEIVAAGFLPLDTLRLMSAMLAAFRVRRVWLMETEVWPSMMLSCIRAGVPAGIVNGRIEERSFGLYQRFRPLYGPLFSAFNVVLAQNESYARRFRMLGSRPDAIHVTGNLKSLIDVAPPQGGQRRALRANLHISDGDFVLTAGCVHAGEGRILRETLGLVNTNGRAIKCIVVPRHLDETASISRELGPAALRLNEIASDGPWDVCIIDKMGILEDMYKAADAAFIGGTFVAVGGHSIWDAAQYALPVFFGPDYHTQQDSFEQLIGAGVAFSAATAQQLAARISEVVRDKTAVMTSAFESLTQSSRQSIERIESLLP